MADKRISPHDELVESVKLYVARPLLFHGYVFPFLICYSGESKYLHFILENMEMSTWQYHISSFFVRFMHKYKGEIGSWKYLWEFFCIIKIN